MNIKFHSFLINSFITFVLFNTRCFAFNFKYVCKKNNYFVKSTKIYKILLTQIKKSFILVSSLKHVITSLKEYIFYLGGLFYDKKIT